MRLSSLVVLTGSLLAQSVFGQDKAIKLPGEDWGQLFNGKDLTGWVEVGKEKWEVQDGVLHGQATTKQYGYLKTAKSYKDFQLSLQFKCNGDGNRGVFFHVDFKPGTADVSQALQFEIDSPSTGTTPPTFTNTSVTITAGSTATYQVTLPSSVTTVSASCLNLPSGASCSYSASSNSVVVTTSSTTPKGTYQITVVFTETVSGVAAAGILLPILLLPLALLRRKFTVRNALFTACLVLAMGVAAFSTGCGGSSSAPTTPTNPTHQVTSSGTVNLTIQ